MKENKMNNNIPLSGKLDQITATNLLEDLQILKIASIYSIRAKMLYEKINQLLLIRQNEATK